MDIDRFKIFLKNRFEKDGIYQKTRSLTSPFIAGGYLLGLSLEFLGHTKSNHDDIDIFHVADPEQDEELTKMLNNGEDWYKFYIRSQDYQLVSQKKQDKFNLVKITFGYGFEWEGLLHDFDLNCVMIGYHLNKDELYIDKQFEQFFKTLEIKIHNKHIYGSKVFFTFNTWCRAIKKQEQYEFLNFNSLHYINEVLRERTLNFTIIEIDLYKGGNFVSKDKLEYLKKIKHPFFKIEDNTLKIINIPKGYNEILRFYRKQDKVFLSKSAIKRIQTYISVVKEKNFSDDIFYLIYEYFPNEDVKKDDLRRLFKLKSEHNGIVSNLRFLITKVDSAKEFFEFVNQLAKDIELVGFSEFISYESNHIFYFKDLVRLKKRMERLEKNNLKIIDYFDWYKKYITQILSSKALIQEGKTMHHCVGGRWYNVKKGRELVFHLNYGNEDSTFSLNPRFNLIEHKTKFNKAPSKRHRFLASLFLNYLKKCF